MSGIWRILVDMCATGACVWEICATGPFSGATLIDSPWLGDGLLKKISLGDLKNEEKNEKNTIFLGSELDFFRICSKNAIL